MSEAGNVWVPGPLVNDTNWIKVDYANHFIRPWCREENCYFCHKSATHKVAEDYNGFGHPYTAYVCCEHFWGC